MLRTISKEFRVYSPLAIDSRLRHLAVCVRPRYVSVSLPSILTGAEISERRRRKVNDTDTLNLPSVQFVLTNVVRARMSDRISCNQWRFGYWKFKKYNISDR